MSGNWWNWQEPKRHRRETELEKVEDDTGDSHDAAEEWQCKGKGKGKPKGKGKGKHKSLEGEPQTDIAKGGKGKSKGGKGKDKGKHNVDGEPQTDNEKGGKGKSKGGKDKGNPNSGGEPHMNNEKGGKGSAKGGKGKGKAKEGSGKAKATEGSGKAKEPADDTASSIFGEGESGGEADSIKDALQVAVRKAQDKSYQGLADRHCHLCFTFRVCTANNVMVRQPPK